jgi:hypothetical protein
VGQVVIGSDQFTASDPAQTFENITLTHKFPLLSTISRMAPSPDWFSGVYDFHPVVDGAWMEDFSVSSYPFDAGTEWGDTYAVHNSGPAPHYVISPLVASTVPSNGVLLDPTGETVLPVAKWSCVLQLQEEPEAAPTPAPTPRPKRGLTRQPTSTASHLTPGPTPAPTLTPTPRHTVAPASNPNEPPTGAEPVCLAYAKTCTLDEDCCSNRCHSGVCRGGNISAADRNGTRISAKDRGSIGGALGRGRHRERGGALRGRT